MLFLCACTQESASTQNQYCLNVNNQCFAPDQSEVQIVLSQPLKIEQPISFKIVWPEPWQVQQSQARLEGKNMYMGQIPIELKPHEQQSGVTGELLIIACTRPDMVWQLTLEVELANGQQVTAHWPFLMTHTE